MVCVRVASCLCPAVVDMRFLSRTQRYENLNLQTANLLAYLWYTNFALDCPFIITTAAVNKALAFPLTILS